METLHAADANLFSVTLRHFEEFNGLKMNHQFEIETVVMQPYYACKYV